MKEKKHINSLLDTIEKKERQKIQAKKRKKSWIYWAGFSIFGLIGWAVMTPTLIGLVLGIWIDKKWPSPLSWTLILTVGGLGLGLFSAWMWISKESKEIEDEKKNDK